MLTLRPPRSSAPRRGRRPAAPDLARGLHVAVVAVVVVLVVDSLTRVTVDLVKGVDDTWDIHLVRVLSLSVLAIMLWHPMAAFALWAVVAPFSHYQPMTAMAWMLLAIRVTATRPWWQALLVVAAGTVFEVYHRATVLDFSRVSAVGTSLAAALATLGLGLAARALVTRRRRNLDRAVDLELASESRRETERAELARDLHDGLAHDLSVITLRTMAGRTMTPPEQREVLVDVRHSADSAMVELRELVSALREQESLALRPPREGPGELLDRMASALAGRGQRLVSSLAPGVELVEGHVRETVLRVLQESLTNALRHAPPGAVVRVEVDRVEGAMLVRVQNPLVAGGAPAEGASASAAVLSMGWGLLGLRERISLLGGQFEAGPQGGTFRVEARIPVQTRTSGEARTQDQAGTPRHEQPGLTGRSPHDPEGGR